MIEEALRDGVADDRELIWQFVMSFEHGEFFDVLLFHFRNECFAVVVENACVDKLPFHGFEIIVCIYRISLSLKYAATSFLDFSYRDHQFSGVTVCVTEVSCRMKM